MLIKLKNKEYLLYNDFKFRCALGKNGLRIKKKEGDKSTPKGTFGLGTVYYRADRVKKPLTKLNIKKISKNMGWCDDPYNKNYNKQILINSNNKGEKLYRNDSIYDIIITVNYNTKKILPNKGSAIFIHLTKNYLPTLGCISLKQNDLIILLKLIDRKTKIRIS